MAPTRRRAWSSTRGPGRSRVTASTERDAKEETRRSAQALRLRLHRDLSALPRRFKPPKQEPQNGVDPRGSIRIAPLLGVAGMVEAAGRIKQRARRGFDVG